MRYYNLFMDERYGNFPQIGNRLPDRFPPRGALANVKSDEFTFFPDILIGQRFFVTKEVMKCIKLFEPNMESEMWILFDKKAKSDYCYYLLAIDEYEDMASVPKDKTIFKIVEDDKVNYVIRQDAFECVSRRGARGVMVSEII